MKLKVQLLLVYTVSSMFIRHHAVTHIHSVLLAVCILLHLALPLRPLGFQHLPRHLGQISFWQTQIFRKSCLLPGNSRHPEVA